MSSPIDWNFHNKEKCTAETNKSMCLELVTARWLFFLLKLKLIANVCFGKLQK